MIITKKESKTIWLFCPFQFNEDQDHLKVEAIIFYAIFEIKCVLFIWSNDEFLEFISILLNTQIDRHIERLLAYEALQGNHLIAILQKVMVSYY